MRWEVYRCDLADSDDAHDRACGVREVSTDLGTNGMGRMIVSDTNRDECCHHMTLTDAQEIVDAHNNVQNYQGRGFMFEDLKTDHLQVQTFKSDPNLQWKDIAKHEDKDMEQTDFGWAIRKLKAGERVARRGWNGKGMWLALQVPDANSKMSLPYIYMSTVDGKLVPWLASQTDVLAEDWTTVA